MHQPRDPECCSSLNSSTKWVYKLCNLEPANLTPGPSGTSYSKSLPCWCPRSWTFSAEPISNFISSSFHFSWIALSLPWALLHHRHLPKAPSCHSLLKIISRNDQMGWGPRTNASYRWPNTIAKSVPVPRGRARQAHSSRGSHTPPGMWISVFLSFSDPVKIGSKRGEKGDHERRQIRREKRKGAAVGICHFQIAWHFIYRSRLISATSTKCIGPQYAHKIHTRKLSLRDGRAGIPSWDVVPALPSSKV